MDDQDERRHILWVKWNDAESGAFPIRDLTTRQYVAFKHNDAELYNYIQSKKPNLEIECLWRSVDDVDYTIVDLPNSSSSLETEKQPPSVDDRVTDKALSEIENLKADSMRTNRTQNNVVLKPEPKRSDNSKGSKVRSYYENKTKDSATCTICKNVFKHDGNTSNLRQHLSRKHDVFFDNTLVSKPKKRRLDDDNNVSQQKTNTDKENSGRIDDCLKRINSFKEGKNADKITRAIVFMIAKDQRELSIVQDEGFQHLLKVTSPFYNVPGRKLITKLMENEYEKLVVPFKENLKTVDHYSLTFDCWTDITSQSYLGATLHYLDTMQEQPRMSNNTLGVLSLDENHTADYLAKAIREILALYELDESKVSSVLSDSAANIKSAVMSVFGQDKRLACHAHLLALVIPDAMKNCPDFQEIIMKVKDIVKLVKQSTPVSDELKRLQIRDGKNENETLKVKQDCETRWNSTLYMIERFLILEEYLHSAIRKAKSPKMMPSCDEIKALHDYIVILKPVEIASTEICGQTYPTAALMIPLIHCLVSAIENVIPETDLGKQLKIEML